MIFQNDKRIKLPGLHNNLNLWAPNNSFQIYKLKTDRYENINRHICNNSKRV